MKALRPVSVVMLVFLGLFATGGVAGASPADVAYDCAGGDVAAGTYTSMLISGVCYMPAGTVVVQGDLTIAPGALLDAAATLGDPAESPVLPATVVVGGNVSVAAGGVLALGCSPLGGCKGVTYDRIGGNLTAENALGVLIQAVSIEGNASILGGGGGAAGGPGSGGCFNTRRYPIPAPWSEDPALAAGSPQYTDFEDSSIGGNLRVVGVQTCYLASFRDQVAGNVTFLANESSDPDGMELGSNLVDGNMTCRANLPAVQFGDGGAAPNMVGGYAADECGFHVVLSNGGSPEHISVSTSTMATYSGAHTQTAAVKQLTLGVTESGDTLTIALNDAVLTGSGLQGSIKVRPNGPLGKSGEVVVASVHPDGSASFEAIDRCKCSFDGDSGTVTIFAYGTTSAQGVTSGRFLIASGGAANGGLSKLAGYGTFNSHRKGTLRLTEHLKLT